MFAEFQPVMSAVRKQSCHLPREKNKTRSGDSCLLEQPHLCCQLLEAAERVRAGTGVGLPACEAGMSGATELSPQSLTDILAEGDGGEDGGLPSV